MRCTLGRWRRVSSTPMYTTHSSPSSAQTVAVATPCWPAPVSAITRRLPILCASSAWPSALLSLCEPVWLRSSRLRYTLPPDALGEPPRAVQRGGAPAEVAQQPVELRAVGGVRAGVHPRLLELGERGHQRLGDVLPPVASEAVLDCAHAGEVTAGWWLF